MQKYLLLLVMAGFLVVSCGKSDEEIFEEDTLEIVDYLQTAGLIDDAQVSPTGLYYIIHEPGNTIKPGLNNTVRCNYKGYFPNGDVFDENNNVEFILGNTIEGWRQGIPLIGEGGELQLFVPSVLAYGKTGSSSGSIGKNEVLFFDVDLIEVK